MPDAHPESHPNTRAGVPSTAQRLYEDPPNVTHRFIAPNLPNLVGWGNHVCFGKDLQGEAPDGPFHWTPVTVETLRLSRATHLMLVEGAAPSWIFLGSRLHDIDKNCAVAQGPLVLLRASYDAMHTTPFHMQNVTFGVPQMREGLKLAQILPIMISAILNTP